ncbi:MAG: helix-turn-helix domain-containing protein [Euryarchaeota archaeon]|nr:helix-turn-helix domain-containing protein [Euryarchaeota archaeon]MDE1837556.1 helix-turn-helix domain-containing protein [Euryarchaeota archaeon]MDE1880037.1 helix-turn-helix domain-containing protein [Euryarchaeota archaeon]MDE2046134.1 helix-turn-helix domain-containing protein [Thermoplasmata archaeon]
MPIVDARVRVHHPCPYCDLSTRFPRTLFLLWCDNRRDVVLISSPRPKELRTVLLAWKRGFHARVLLREGNDALVIVPDFEWPDPPSVTRLARSGGVWALHPVLYFGGEETYRFLAPSRALLQQLCRKLRKLGAVEVLSVTDRAGLESVRTVPAATVHLLEGLTEPQARSLVAARDAGLLEVPARSNWAEVARAQGLSRSTFGEHLRKGQRKLLENSYPLLRARLGSKARRAGSAMEKREASHRRRQRRSLLTPGL